MQIFSPLDQLGSQPVPGSITWDSEVESESGNTFDACFSEMLSADDDVDKDACSGASRQTSEQMKAEEPDTNREDFSPARNHDKAQARENVAGSDTQPDAHDQILSEASATVEDDLNTLMDQLVALIQSRSQDQVADGPSRTQGSEFSLDDETGRLQQSFLESTKQQDQVLVEDNGELKNLLRRLEQHLATKDAGELSGSVLGRKMQDMNISANDMAAIKDMLRSVLSRDGENLVQAGGHQTNELVMSEGDARVEFAAGRQALQTLFNDKVHMESGSMQGAEEPQRFIPGQSGTMEKVAARDKGTTGEPGQVRAGGDFPSDSVAPGGRKQEFADQETSSDPGFAGSKEHTAKTPETTSRSDGLFARTFLEHESSDQPRMATRTNVSRQVLDQVQQGAFRTLSQGRKQLSLQLNPADLGTVNVILQVKGKEVNAVLKTSHEDTSRILGEQMVQLKDHLEKQGLKVVKLEVQNQMASNDQPGQWSGGSEHNQSRERFEAGMRELRWRSLRSEGEALARDVQSQEHTVNVSPRGVDFFA